ncbi:hemopexin repeat-containing protein [Streptomyces sp. NBC_00160]|uniref:hemopexin repeat-containing protein n=1 Tax=Streptomyces sp. NBC_00160 TaxID=2903628 RepID=UPI00224DF8CB|nr:hemopexin repeat-containing protein [Streptomyces sp. NBC_00160]MCX5302831.1 hemopexin repeat-containing protein [Streptomyces sp. NBC_00160]
MRFDKDISAVLTRDQDTAYLFKEAEYVRWNIKEGKVDAGYPKNIADYWPGFREAGFTSDIDAAVVWPGKGKAYFFKGPDYLRFDIKADKVDEGYPKKIVDYWPGLAEAGVSQVHLAWVAPED